MIFSILVNIECIVDFSEFSPGKNKAKISPDIRGVSPVQNISPSPSTLLQRLGLLGFVLTFYW